MCMFEIIGWSTISQKNKNIVNESGPNYWIISLSLQQLLTGCYTAHTFRHPESLCEIPLTEWKENAWY